MTDQTCNTDTSNPRVLMPGTFGLRPKGTMSARAAGVAAALQRRGWEARIVTVPWDNPADAGATGMVEGVPFLNTRVVRPAFWPLAVAEILRDAHRFRPDVIHLFKPKGFGDLAARVLKRQGYPVVVDMDDWEGSAGWNDVLEYGLLQRSVFDVQERTWPSRADGITAASVTLVHRAIELGADERDVLYLPNRLSEARIDELRNPPATPSKPYGIPHGDESSAILLYTRFVEFNPEFVVQILSGMVQRVLGANLVIAGRSADGLAEKELLKLAREAGIADRVIFLGWIAPIDLAWIARRCRVALMPFDDSLINRAKCSVKLLELLVCGIPVVASAVGENRHFLDASKCGFLARPGSVGHHVERIHEALRYREVGRQNTSESRWWEPERCSWDSVSALIESHYRRALNATGSFRKHGAAAR